MKFCPPTGLKKSLLFARGRKFIYLYTTSRAL